MGKIIYMMSAKNSRVERLLQEVDANVLDKMPEWFKRLGEVYLKRSAVNQRK